MLVLMLRAELSTEQDKDDFLHFWLQMDSKRLLLAITLPASLAQ